MEVAPHQLDSALIPIEFAQNDNKTTNHDLDSTLKSI